MTIKVNIGYYKEFQFIFIHVFKTYQTNLLRFFLKFNGEIFFNDLLTIYS